LPILRADAPIWNFWQGTSCDHQKTGPHCLYSAFQITKDQFLYTGWRIVTPMWESYDHEIQTRNTKRSSNTIPKFGLLTFWFQKNPYWQTVTIFNLKLAIKHVMNCGVRSCKVRSYRPIRIITESLSKTSNRPEISVKPLQLFIMAAAILSQVFDIIWEWSLQTQGGPWTMGICSIRVCALTEGMENINLIHVSSQNQTCVGEHIPYSPSCRQCLYKPFLYVIPLTLMTRSISIFVFLCSTEPHSFN
jgi:hypothetical protein